MSNSLRTRRKALLRVATKPELEDSRGRTFLKGGGEGGEEGRRRQRRNLQDLVSTIRSSSMGYATYNATDTPSIISVTSSRRGCRDESSMTMRCFEAQLRLWECIPHPDNRQGISRVSRRVRSTTVFRTRKRRICTRYRVRSREKRESQVIRSDRSDKLVTISELPSVELGHSDLPRGMKLANKHSFVRKKSLRKPRSLSREGQRDSSLRVFTLSSVIVSAPGRHFRSLERATWL